MATIRIDTGGSVNMNVSVTDEGKPITRYATMDVSTTYNLIRTLAVKKPDIRLDYFGLYSFGTFNKGGDVKWVSLSLPKHVLQSHQNGCVWNGKGMSNADITTATKCTYDFMGEQCPDALGECFEGLLGNGRSAQDMLATPEGRALFNQFLNLVFQGIGDSLQESIEFGQHSQMTTSDSADAYLVSDKEWADFMENQAICRGRITHIDYLKTQGEVQFDNDISGDDIDDTDTSLYTGTPTTLFKSVLDSAKPDFRTHSRRSRSTGNAPIFEVTESIFDAYEEELLDTYSQIPTVFYRFYTGKFCASNGCIETEPIPDVLKWKGYTVVSRSDWKEWDSIVGYNTHRVLLSARGVYGLAFDVPNLSQYDGIGMEITQKLEAPYKGKIYMDTRFSVANAILNKDWIVNYSTIVAPA